MLTNIRLQNFRCFSDHSIPFRQCTIIVGRNNAGKSTLVDALRIVSLVTARYRTLPFRDPPRWGDLPRREIGISPSLSTIEFNSQNLFHRYGEAPAVITASFHNNATAKIYVGPEAQIHAVITAPDGSLVRTRAIAAEGLLPRLEIMPQVAPVHKSETILEPDYVRRNLSSTLASHHFRNQLNVLSDRLPRFRRTSR